MTPKLIIFTALGSGAVFYLYSVRRRLPGAVAAAVRKLLDSLAIGYAVYVIVAIVLKLSVLDSWTALEKLLFFTEMKGNNFFGIAIGAFAAWRKFFSPPVYSPPGPIAVYQGGQRLLSHKVALQIANAMLVSRAFKEKKALPQHLSPGVRYEFPEEHELEKIEPLEDVETNGALTAYVSKPEELETVQWGMLRVPYKETESHFLVVGSTGSGKTILIHELMRSVLPKIKIRPNFRAFVYDNKPDFIPFVRTLGLEEYVWNFDPFDADGYAWDIAADVISHAAANQITNVLVPVDENLHEPFFQQAVHNLFEAVLIRLREIAGNNWTLRDVILCLDDDKRLKRLLDGSNQSARLADSFFQAKRSFDDIRTTIRTKLRRYDIVASLWSKAPKEKRKSINEWAKSNAILVITHRDVFEEAVKPINQVLFKMASMCLLNQRDSNDRASWFFLDEIREIGKLQGYHALANKGRSKGIRLVLGFQSLVGLRAEHRDENAADEIAEVIGNKTFLHIDCLQTREWAARHVGNYVVDETVFSQSTSQSKQDFSVGSGANTNRVTRPALEAVDFYANLKRVSPENGLTAINMVPAIGTYVSHVPFEWIEQNCPKSADQDQTENLRSAEDQEIQIWTPEELHALGLPEDFLVESVPDATEIDLPSRDDLYSQTLNSKVPVDDENKLNNDQGDKKGKRPVSGDQPVNELPAKKQYRERKHRA